MSITKVTEGVIADGAVTSGKLSGPILTTALSALNFHVGVGSGTTSLPAVLNIQSRSLTRDGGYHGALQITPFFGADNPALFFAGISDNINSGILWTSSIAGNTTNQINAYITLQKSGAGANILFGTNGGIGTSFSSTKMIITSAGNVGIGTVNPSQKLSIDCGSDLLGGLIISGSNAPQIRLNDTTDGATFSSIGAQNDGVLIIAADDSNSAANSYLSLRVDTTEHMRIDSTGNISIPGTSSPTGRLHVVGSGSIAGSFVAASDAVQQTILLATNSTNSAYWSLVGAGATSVVGTWTNGSIISEAVPYSGGNYIISSYTNSITFQTNLRTERMRIDSSGNVGIGTTSPSGILDVKKASNGGDVRAYIRNSSSAAGSTTTIDLSEDGTLRGGIQYSPNTGETKIGNISTGTYPVTFYTSATERLRIDSSGRVGIGTTSPQRALHIVDTNSLTEILRLQSYSNTANAMIGFYRNNGTSKGSLGFWSSVNEEFVIYNGENGPMFFYTNGVERMRIAAAGNIYCIGAGTTASAANAVLNASSSPVNELLRSTSSLRYKTDIEDLWNDRADIIYQLRPVWYRSKCEADRKDWSWYGLVAEEVARLEPRLVSWIYLENPYKTVTKTIDSKIQTVTELDETIQQVPDGVQYDRLTVLLVKAIQELKKEITELKARTI